MNTRIKSSKFTCTGCLVTIFLSTFLAWWTQSTLNFWLSYFTNKPIHVPFWLSLLLTWLVNAGWLAINIISEILKLCV